MVGEKIDIEEARTASGPEAGTVSKRDRSTIDFPYLPLEAAMETAAALYTRCAFGSCDQDELAAEMGQTVSGAFRQKTSAARSFGLIEKDGRSAFVLTQLGRRAVSSESSSAPLVEAFLHVPLYGAVFEKFRGHVLPPPKALEREMETLGVAHKQTDRARQAFERSAQYAGFFESGKERLVKPKSDAGSEISSPTEPESSDPGNRELVDFKTGGSGGGGGNLPPDIDPIIRGLIDRLPPAGSNWSPSKRKLWLNILESSFDLVYEADEATDDAKDIRRQAASVLR